MVTKTKHIPELDIDQLDADLYRALRAVEKEDFATALPRIYVCWGHVRQFRLSLPPLADDRHLPATTDRDWRALLTKAWYWLRNRRPRPCRRLGFHCEWVYPYGFVAEAGCPYHD